MKRFQFTEKQLMKLWTDKTFGYRAYLFYTWHISKVFMMAAMLYRVPTLKELSYQQITVRK